MAVSGWFVALLAFGVVPTVLLDAPWFVAVWLGLLLVLLVLDLLLAGIGRWLTPWARGRAA